MSFDDEWIRKNIRCCACRGSLEGSLHVNGICLDKEATWKYPVWGNILVKDKFPESRATGIICDRCLREKRPVKYAVEWREIETITEALKERKLSKVIYHKVEDLKELPEITEKDLPRTWICPRCGALNHTDPEICFSCGFKRSSTYEISM